MAEEFDPNQSAVDYGESLLASQAANRKKARKRRRRIDRVNQVMAGFSVADQFLRRNALEKVETFKNNLTADKANAINSFNLAKSFREHELEALQKTNPGLDFNNAESWKVTYDANGNLIKAGAVFNALKKEYSNNLKSEYGIGSMGSVLPEDRERFRLEVLDQTKQAFSALEAKYAKHKPSLGLDKELIESRYKTLIDEGSRQLLSARNTSSVRKLLSKFGIADDIDKSLTNVEMGGVNLYMRKDLVEAQQKRLMNNIEAELEYIDLMSKRGDQQVKISNTVLRSGMNSAQTKARSLYSHVYAESDKYSYAVDPDTLRAVPPNVIEPKGSGQNSRIKALDSISFSHEDNNNEESMLLSSLPTTSDNVYARYSEVYDSLVQEKRYDDLKELQKAIDLNIKELVETKMEREKIDDASLISLSMKEIAAARYDAVMDLVQIQDSKGRLENGNGRLFNIKVTPYAEFINAQAELNKEDAKQRDELIETGENEKRKGKLSINAEGERIITSPTGQTVTVDDLFDNFESLIIDDLKRNNGEKTTVIFNAWLTQELPVELHGEATKLYNDLLKRHEERYKPDEIMMNPYIPPEVMIREMSEAKKKRVVDRAMNTQPTTEFLNHLKDREGFRDEVYLDSLGKPTVGTGHLLTEEENKQYKVGDRVPDNILNKWLEEDSIKAWTAALKQSKELGIDNLNFIEALASVNFQLGINWNKIHKNTWKFLQTKEYDKAAAEAADSTWFKQTPIRVKDFQNAIENL